MVPRYTRFRANPSTPKATRFSVELLRPHGEKPKFFSKKKQAIEEGVIWAYDRNGLVVVSDEKLGELIAQIDAKSKKMLQFE